MSTQRRGQEWVAVSHEHFVIIEAMKHFCILITLFSLFFVSCRDTEPVKEDIVKKPELLEDRIRENLNIVIKYAADNAGKINDTTSLHLPNLLKNIYDKNGYSSIWSTKGRWSRLGDSLVSLY